MKKNFESQVVRLSLWSVFPTLILLVSIFIYSKIHTENRRIQGNLKGVALAIADIERVKKSVENNRFNLEQYTNIFVETNEDVDIIVIADMKGMRYTHPDLTKIGKKFGTDDSKEVLKKGRGYSSLTRGSQGLTLRRFEPIVSHEKQVGFIMVGKYFSVYKKDVILILIQITFVFIILLLIILISSKKFAKGIKQKMLNLEPEEITDLYITTKRLTKQQASIINNVYEGIIVLDADLKVTNINKKVNTIFKNFNIESFIKKFEKKFLLKKDVYFEEVIFLKEKVFISITHLNDGDLFLGVIVMIYKHIDIINLAQELTSINNIITGFRENNHEFKNKLQVIHGLIELKKYDLVNEYIDKFENSNLKFLTEISDISDYYILGILIGKLSSIKENHIEFCIDEGSNLYSEHGIITSLDIITIVSNLIENSMDCLNETDREDKKIELFLTEDEETIQISVFDNGKMIDSNLKKDMFTRYISSKGKNRGIGLAIVKSKIELYNGYFILEEESIGKTFTIVLNKEDGKCIEF